MIASLQASGAHRFVFSNLWLLSPLMKLILAAKEETDALQRTTTAITVFNAGLKVLNRNRLSNLVIPISQFVAQSNVVPGRASALVNHRIHPGQTVEQVIAHDRSVMNDPRVKIDVQSFYPPMKVSPYGPDVAQYAVIARSIKQVFPESIIAPGTNIFFIASLPMLCTTPRAIISL